MGITERRQRQKEEVRTSILDAARQVAMEEGWDALSIRKIADAIEYSVPVIYDHFENKDAILHEFTKEGFVLMADCLKRAKDKHQDPAEQLIAMADAYWHFAFTEKAYYQLMFGLGMPTCDMVRKVPEIQLYSGLLMDSIKQIIAASSHPETDSFLKYLTFFSTLHGLVSINLVGPGSSEHDPKMEMVLQDAVTSFIKALKA